MLKRLIPFIVASAAIAGTASIAHAATGATPYYANCDAVRAAGKAPLYKGQPGYRSQLDGDHDGVACETGAGGRGATPTTKTRPVPTTKAKPHVKPAPAVPGSPSYTG